MSASKLHNKLLSSPKSASADSPGAKSRQPIGTAQEAVDPSPGPHPAPDARSPAPRKNPRGPAPQGALLQASDACGNLPQKITRTPVPVRQERSRRGRPYPQNRDGSGNAGLAEGSLPRLAPEGQDIEQEIALLRSLANRLLSRRRINYPYLFRCLNLIARCTTVKASYFKNESDEEINKIAAGMRRVLESTMADRTLEYRDFLPIILAKPGERWTPYKDILPIHPELLDSILEVKDAWEREHGSPFVDDSSDGEEPPPFGMRPLPPHLYQPPDDDPPPEPPVIPASPGAHPPIPTQDNLDPPPSLPVDPPSSFMPIEIGGPHYEEMDPFPSPIDATGRSPGWADPVQPTSSKAPRIARGRPPP